jgi:hypothetical protein
MIRARHQWRASFLSLVGDLEHRDNKPGRVRDELSNARQV